MPRSQREIQAALDQASYSFNPETDYDDFAENREGGPRDHITDLAVKAFKSKRELEKRTFETSDLHQDHPPMDIVLPEYKPDTDDENRDS
jgi:hypothetical protein